MASSGTCKGGKTMAQWDSGSLCDRNKPVPKGVIRWRGCNVIELGQDPWEHEVLKSTVTSKTVQCRSVPGGTSSACVYATMPLAVPGLSLRLQFSGGSTRAPTQTRQARHCHWFHRPAHSLHATLQSSRLTCSCCVPLKRRVVLAVSSTFRHSVHRGPLTCLPACKRLGIAES